MSETHIKVPPTPPEMRLLADGSRTDFAYGFPIFEVDDMEVRLNGAVQTSGYSVAGVGETHGGAVSFASPPPAGTVVTLARRLTFAREGDFTESGPFSAHALNSELDRLTASLQQEASDRTRMLHLGLEDTASTQLPNRALRANRALGFDGDGNPAALPVGTITSLPVWLPSLPGAVERTIPDKLMEAVSVRDFGARGDGITDDTAAFQTALAEAKSVFVPPGTYNIATSLDLTAGKSLFGAGASSIIQALTDDFDVIRLPGDFARLEGLTISGGRTGILLYGRDRPCVQNILRDLVIDRAQTGIVLDGHVSTDRPCYWNLFDAVLVSRPAQHGIHLKRSGAGDTPNANRFHQCRVYSHGAAMTGSGIHVEAGRYHNAFTDCEVNLWPHAHSCVRLGAQADKTLFVGLYTETTGAVTNVLLEAGSKETALINLFSASAGAAIWDLTGGEYLAVNAGYPEKNRLARSRITDLTVERLRFDTEYLSFGEPTSVTLDLSASMVLVSAAGGTVEASLPPAGATEPNGAPLYNGVQVTIKKVDATRHPVLVTEAGGNGPDGGTIGLRAENAFVTVVSNGSEWHVIGASHARAEADFHETPGTIDPDVTRSVHLVSTHGGAITFRLPPHDAEEAIGRTVTVKKSNAEPTPITITEQGYDGPDGRSWTLSKQHSWLSFYSNGAGWHLVGASDPPRHAYYHGEGPVLTPDGHSRLYLVSAWAEPVQVALPNAGNGATIGKVMTIKKSDVSANAVSVTEIGGPGPDAETITLAERGHAVTVMSDGGGWHILGRNP